MRALAPISVKVVRLSDATLPVGLGFREAAEDDWPDLVTKIKAADIVWGLLITPHATHELGRLGVWGMGACPMPRRSATEVRRQHRIRVGVM
jgi:hypothetical protein